VLCLLIVLGLVAISVEGGPAVLFSLR
jgi:hypothetical protein